ncbi:TIGR02221 family CRISPR-associated protein [Rhodocaloribacter sp.]
MIALSFLGTGNYAETTYVLGDRRWRSRFFCDALPHFFETDRLLVAMTNEARDKHAKALAELCDFEVVKVPSGKNEAELWELFEALADAVPAGSEMLLDVTHGFRSQPILALAVAVYLQAAKNVALKGIYYGAWEARDEARDETPVFDLTPFQQLMEWSSASRFFLRSGDAAALNHLLTETQSRTYLHPNSPHKAKALSATGKTLQALTRALALAQPLAAVQTARKLPGVLNDLKLDLEHLPQTRPFALLLDPIRQRYQPLIDAEDRLFTPEGFRAQAEMIRIYLKTDRLQQALTLSREAVVSWLCAHKNGTTDPAVILEREHRQEVQDHLNELVARAERHELADDAPKKRLADFWAQLRDVRNHVNHAGMRTEELSLNRLYRNAEKLARKAAQWILEDPETGL